MMQIRKGPFIIPFMMCALLGIAQGKASDLSPAEASAQRPRHISLTSADTPEYPRSRAMKMVLTEVFRRMGMTLTVVHMPSERSLRNADAGIEDGNFVRASGIKAHPNLIMVPERIYDNHLVAFSKNRDIRVNGWESLLPYDVAYVRGWKICDRHLKNAKSVTKVRDEALLLRLLEKGRADVGIFGKETGIPMLEKLGISNVFALESPVLITDLFLYMHKKHKHLIPEIAETIQEVKQDGTYERLIRSAYNQGTEKK